MKHISMTPFGRQPDSAGLSVHRALADAPCPAGALDKWALLRDLSTARRAFGVSDRDLAVLQTLLSFHPGQALAADGPTIVFPSNARLSERLHGMPESTLRRHLAALVAAGLVLRHDSPNGKRFARRDAAGGIARAFGFDLRPLLVRAPDIACAAEQAHEEAEELRALREETVLHLRDITRLSGATAEAVDLHRLLRRKLSLPEARELAVKAAKLAADAHASQPVAKIPGGYDSQNERHIQDSYKLPSDSESRDEEKAVAPVPLATVLDACPASADYAPRPIHDWPGLIATAQIVCPMMGVSPDVWHEARRHMGPADAAIAVLCILQRFERIARPGAYLRSLSKKARSGAFQAGAMVRALITTAGVARVDSCQLR